LYYAIWKDPAISYYVEREQDYDRVLDIFVRANEGGTRLTSDEVILSMFGAQNGAGGAKKKVYGLIDRVNNQLPRRNAIDQRFVMRTWFSLGDLPVRYRVNYPFQIRTLSGLKSSGPKLEDAILRTLTLVNKFGIDQSKLRRTE